MSDKKIIKLTKIILDVMFLGGILVFITIPFTLKLAGSYYSAAIGENYFKMLFIFAPSGAFGVMIIAQLRKIMKTVIREDCFIWENARSLEIMGILSLCITVLFIGKLFFLPTPATAIIIIVFFIAALFSEVLAQVFREAIRYKEDNELTI